MDLDISMRSSDCPFTVQFYGALFMEGDVWICMEVMDMSLDKFYDKVYKNNREIPETILGGITVAVRYLISLVPCKFCYRINFSSVLSCNLGSECFELSPFETSCHSQRCKTIQYFD